MRFQLLLAAGMVCGFLGCQKEPDAALITDVSCKLDKIYTSDFLGSFDTASFEYTNDKASRVNHADYYDGLEYSGNHLVKRNIYETGGTAIVGVDEFQYNPDSTVSKIVYYIGDNTQPQPGIYAQFDFTYTAGRLTYMITNVFDVNSGGLLPLEEAYFAYTGDNITEVIFHEFDAQITDTLTYSYDAKPNYYRKQPNLWLTDMMFVNFEGYLLPLALSANNVTTVIDTRNNITPVDYEETDKQEIASISIDGQIWARYQYKCQ